MLKPTPAIAAPTTIGVCPSLQKGLGLRSSMLHALVIVCRGKNTMTWGFQIGRVYNRRGDIHGRFGGQQQGGIVTPAQHPIVIIITGEEGSNTDMPIVTETTVYLNISVKGRLAICSFAREIAPLPSIRLKEKDCCSSKKHHMDCALKERWCARGIMSKPHLIYGLPTQRHRF